MKYQTQKVAMLYFAGALALFLVQVLFGVLAGTDLRPAEHLSELLPFNIVRMIHTNALIVWLLMGFIGATYYPPAGGGRDRARTARCSPISSSGLFMSARWRRRGRLPLRIHEGREFLEQPSGSRSASSSSP